MSELGPPMTYTTQTDIIHSRFIVFLSEVVTNLKYAEDLIMILELLLVNLHPLIKVQLI